MNQQHMSHRHKANHKVKISFIPRYMESQVLGTLEYPNMIYYKTPYYKSTNRLMQKSAD